MSKDVITPELAERILSADFKNLVKKVSEGKALTAAERELIKTKAAGCEDSSLRAKTYEQLADLMGVSVRTINRWRKLQGAPAALADGMLPVIEWRQFIRAHQLRGQATPQAETLKARKLLAEVEEREIRTAILKGEYILLETVRQDWTSRVGQAIALLRAKFENELPPILVGKEAGAIQAECMKAIDEVCRTLHNGGKATP